MGRKEEKNPNPIHVVSDVVEDILLRLPWKPIMKFKTVSKQWRSILESKSFAERRKSVQKKQKILAVGDQAAAEPRFEGNAEIDVVYLQCNDATTGPSLTCDGLVCIPVPDWINVLNPSTGEFLRFPSGPSHYGIELYTEDWWTIFPGYWGMGFGRDKVSGNYKVVRMLFDFKYFEIHDVNIGEWRKPRSPPPYKVDATRKSACVNGSIYWLDTSNGFLLLALDLHTEEFRDVPILAPPPVYSLTPLIVNLEDRLALVDTCTEPEWKLEIWSMDAQEEAWTLTYSISLSHRFMYPKCLRVRWFTPLAVSKDGNLFLYDSYERLLKYHPETDLLTCLSPHICVIASCIEDLVPLGSQPGFVPKISSSGQPYGLAYLQPPCLPSKITTSAYPSRRSRMESLIPNILLISTLVSLTIFGFSYKYST